MLGTSDAGTRRGLLLIARCRCKQMEMLTGSKVAGPRDEREGGQGMPAVEARHRATGGTYAPEPRKSC